MTAEPTRHVLVLGSYFIKVIFSNSVYYQCRNYVSKYMIMIGKQYLVNVLTNVQHVIVCVLPVLLTNDNFHKCIFIGLPVKYACMGSLSPCMNVGACVCQKCYKPRLCKTMTSYHVLRRLVGHPGLSEVGMG